jgi:hypothetical protein
MKKLLTEWRKFLAEGEVKYGGILKLKLDSAIIADIQRFQEDLKKDEEGAIMLPEKALHVTLIHQSILKPHIKQVKGMEFPPAPDVILGDKIIEKTSPEKKSWVVELKNQDEMRNYVATVMASLGSENTNPEPDRVFHISLANLTGDPKDSVR